MAGAAVDAEDDAGGAAAESSEGTAPQQKPFYMGLSEAQYRQYGKEIVKGFLFLASRFDADDPSVLKQHKITHILNVAEECEPAAEARKLCSVLHIPLRDSPRTDILGRFEEAFKFIDAAKKNKGRVLVHCFEGRNRSASFVIGYKMQTERLRMDQAFSQVKAVRSLVDPNIGYRKQLLDLEHRLFGAGMPSMPLSEEVCCDLMDMEVISAENLWMYTDAAAVQYEGKTIDVVRPPAAAAVEPKALAAAEPKVKAQSKAQAKAKAETRSSSRGAAKAAARTRA
eukprot:gnl/TRDRNA2_/TRDRNA2_94701_c0_seq1.p1 gnl/TRDRNA2_/TRDRNA2_94701_c0~~gnl/TRDRNA2_/TRDRNA2_94701_c0_seq1.p1  ORF type:complete len:283 (-),score=67.09 gnl/TRDRNA2_/TRDRNA2_94701_c0_seq1:283-1131(-)